MPIVVARTPLLHANSLEKVKQLNQEFSLAGEKNSSWFDLKRGWEANKRVPNAVLGCNPKSDRMISAHFQGKPFHITVIQVYAPTSNAEKAVVEWFYEDLQDLLELTPQKVALFIIGDWTAKVGSQATPGVTGKFGLGIQNEAGQRLIEF